ncbi:MAG: glycosyltransferase family 2 protein [Candidatus Taylorbacteria bacterium]|nr:glycosyltransferase family 2 protein [Candidatus Taylorbacteria bacterium]
METQPQASEKGISVIIPALNEEGGIGNVILDIKKVLNGVFPYEIIVVDDGSTDKTATVARELGAKIVHSPVTMGYGFSLKRGFREARYEYAIITDGDSTYPQEKILDLVKKLETGFDMVVGIRRGASINTRHPARLLFKHICEFVVGKKIPDINSGFRAIRRSKIVPLLGDFSNGFSFSTSSTMIFTLKGYFIGYIPIHYGKRVGKSKVRFIRDTARTAQILTDIIVHYNPIKLFILLSLIPLLLFVILLTTWIWSSNHLLLLPSVIVFCFTILIFSIGLIANIFRKDL